MDKPLREIFAVMLLPIVIRRQTALILNDHNGNAVQPKSARSDLAEIQKNNPGNSTVSAAIYSRIFELLEKTDVIQGSFTNLVQFIRENIKDV